MKKIFVICCLLFSIKSSAQIGIESMAISTSTFSVRDTIEVTLRIKNYNTLAPHDPSMVPAFVSVGLPAATKVVRLASAALEGSGASKFDDIVVVDSFNFTFDLIGSIPATTSAGSIIEVKFKLEGYNITPSGSAPQFIVQLQKPLGDLVGEIPELNTVMSPVLTVLTPLSVQSLNFDAQKINNDAALLNWNTLKEVHNKGFEVMKSADGINWETIAFVKSKAADGYSDVEIKYSLVDNNPFQGYNYYKLKQIDNDGKYTYSITKMLVFETGSSVVIDMFPNPASDHIVVKGGNNGNVYNIVDMQGRIIAKGILTSSHTLIDISNMLAGAYVLNISDNESVIWQRTFTKK